MFYPAGATRHGFFITRNAGTGALANADSTPTVTVYRNGSAEGAVSPTVTNVATGRYRYNYTVGAWTAGDTVVDLIAATVDTVPGEQTREYIIDATISSRATPAQAGTELDNRNLTAALVAQLETDANDAAVAAEHTRDTGLPAVANALLDAQDVADALKLAPAAGDPADGSAYNRFTDLDTAVAAIPTNPTNGSGDYTCDHDGGTGAGAAAITVDGTDSETDILRYLYTGNAVDNVTIRVYEKTAYDAGTRTLIGSTSTGSDGRWVAPLMLDSGTYYVISHKPGLFEADTKTIVVP